MAYDNTNRGAIFRNTKKEKETHPDYTGTINVEGVEYFIDGWLKETKTEPKKKFFSFSLKRKNKQSGHQSAPQQQRQQPPPQRRPPPPPIDDTPSEEDIPF